MCIPTPGIQIAIELTHGTLTKISDEKIRRLEKNSQIDCLWEAIAYQNLQAKSHASGKLSTDSALWLYNLLGGEVPSMETFNKRGLSERIVAMEMFAHLAK